MMSRNKKRKENYRRKSKTKKLISQEKDRIQRKTIILKVPLKIGRNYQKVIQEIDTDQSDQADQEKGKEIEVLKNNQEEDREAKIVTGIQEETTKELKEMQGTEIGMIKEKEVNQEEGETVKKRTKENQGIESPRKKNLNQDLTKINQEEMMTRKEIRTNQTDPKKMIELTKSIVIRKRSSRKKRY